MITFSAPTNWDPALIDFYAGLPVTEVFGSLPTAPLGSGRAFHTLPKVDRTMAERHVAYAREKGIAFNYILNAPCMGNMEYDRVEHRRLIDHLRWIDSTGVEAVTVTIPYLIGIIREQFPRLRVKASVIAQINSVQRALAYQNLGVHEINIDYMCNRDFKLLAALRQAVTVDLSLLANDQCLYQCPYRLYHYNTTGHSTQEGHALKGDYYDYCMISCTIEKYSHPEQLIRARWIRPEDLNFYERQGFSKIKLSGRNMSIDWIKRAVSAYAAQSYHGNLADILSGTGFTADGTVHYAIDNDALEGFLDYFLTSDCTHSCTQCTYCRAVADRAVSFTPVKADRYLRSILMLRDGLTSSTVFNEPGDIS
jgi:collagenase-like PrtC family protease